MGDDGIVPLSEEELDEKLVVPGVPDVPEVFVAFEDGVPEVSDVPEVPEVFVAFEDGVPEVPDVPEVFVAFEDGVTDVPEVFVADIYPSDIFFFLQTPFSNIKFYLQILHLR